MTILLTKDIRVAGSVVTAGTQVTYSAEVEADLVRRESATYVTDPMPAGGRDGQVEYVLNESKEVTGLAGAFFGALVSGVWFKVPSIFRLRLTGTGTVVLDSKDSLGTITTSVASYSPSAATDQIEFPYAGEDAVMIRVTLTGSATAEVI